MRPLGAGTFRFSHADSCGSPVEGEPSEPVSWFSLAEAGADRATSIGFALIMLLFAAAAIYGLALAHPETPILSGTVGFVDRAAAGAGFRIEELSRSGVKNAPPDAILQALQLPHDGSIFSYDTEKARAKLLELGWVEEAEVRRILPSRLDVAIVERTPFARWSSGGKVLLTDREGRILGEDAGSKFSQLLLTAGEGAPAEAAPLLEALKGHESLRAQIECAELVAGRFWSLKLSNGLVVKLPRKVGALTLKQLESLLASSKIAEMGLGTLDLRLPQRTVLQLRDATVAKRDKAIALLAIAPATRVAAPARKGIAP